MPKQPLIVEVTRGPQVECRHRVHVCVSDLDGNLVRRHGDEHLRVLPRSALKMLQALAMAESGAVQAFDLSDFQLSLACASHSSEPYHAQAVTGWLDSMGLGEDDLVCGGHWGFHQHVLIEQARAGDKPGPVYAECSGKHCGMLALAKHLGADIRGYERVDHPVQQRIIGVIEAMSHSRIELGNVGWDGCGAPNYPLPLGHLALAMANWADPQEQPARRQDAIERVTKAIWAHPEAIAGEGRYCTWANGLHTRAGTRLIAKTGAEGVFCAALPDAGLGIALKVEDGATRASEVALTWILDQLGVFDDLPPQIAEEALARRQPSIMDLSGQVVGQVRVAAP